MKFETIPVNAIKPLRIDLFLSNYFPDFSRTQIKKMIKSGNIRVNNFPVKPSYQLDGNETIDYIISLPENQNTKLKAQKIDLDIIYEDASIIAINKPPGLVVHPGNGNEDGTLVNGLLYYFDKLSNINGEDRPGIVHRLDKNTSGVILIAKTNQAHKHLSYQFEKRLIEKKYFAITWGSWKEEQGLIDHPIKRAKKDPTVFEVNNNGRRATTGYSLSKRGKYLNQVFFSPKTGRTHQIRVHASFVGCPIFCDDKYGGGLKKARGFLPEVTKIFTKIAKNLNRQALHAEEIIFNHPNTNKKMTLRAPIPEDLNCLLNQLNLFNA